VSSTPSDGVDSTSSDMAIRSGTWDRSVEKCSQAPKKGKTGNRLLPSAGKFCPSGSGNCLPIGANNYDSSAQLLGKT
jgi:hypothetical protein